MLNRETELGTIKITREAISSLTTGATLECYGVVGMALPDRRDGLVERLHRHVAGRGIVVHEQGHSIAIDLYVVLAHGVRISEVAQNVADRVKYTVERAAGNPVGEVNVHVQEVKDTGKPRLGNEMVP